MDNITKSNLSRDWLTNFSANHIKSSITTSKNSSETTTDGKYDITNNSHIDYESNTTTTPVKFSKQVYAIILAVLDGFLMAPDILLVSDTGLKHKENVLVPLIWQYGVGSIIVPILMPVQNQVTHVDLGMGFNDALLVAIHVVSLVADNALMIASLYYCDAFLVGLCRTSNLVFMAISSWTVLWGVIPAHHNALAVIGIVIILTGSVVRIFNNAFDNRAAEDTREN